MYALTNCTLYTGHQILTDRALLIEGSRIVEIVPQAHLLPDWTINQTIDQTIDLAGNSVAPGFIDLQLNGCGGVMFNDCITAATLETMHYTNLKSGTTSFLPTLITTSDHEMQVALELVRHYRQHHPHRVLGLHLEGPYLNPKRKGIHNESYIRPPDRTMLQHIAEYGRETVKLVTLAPEQAQPDEIRLLTEAGIVVSGGHTDATYEQAIAGFEAGVSMVTHLFNAMTPWLGRSPGMVGAVFSRGDIYAGIIADGFHVHYESIRLAHCILQDRLILVTDATPPVGTNMPAFWIGGQEVFYQNGKCVSADGTLGGSALTLIEAVANCVRYVGIPLPEALRMATLYPARAIGVDNILGQIAPGYVANLVIFDANFQIQGLVQAGQYTADCASVLSNCS
ncbi:N-acetylglucosamine-6-phosphate deacetylase [Thermocoleostomius sinensis]|uniref:N-acetylglucosamine-6-phosphate deacetylase n=1 Tax=Thermocoleostomius sinensis A174 TaxID=2016057 RepID=A0A9E8Z9I7_9CYAN|nr:N-acetylglucosamine-6-phosphate deacetylase [Thermocoleostomius sinensis]WAL59038.1 N-acetylglucosamine-6-phosphate deacetylase [Thermocoleostomius sinensis A174]